jgi:tetratricopeptide (TPR) repeat protein
MYRDPERAADLARRATELAPEDPATLFKAAWLAFNLGRLADARGYLDAARKHEPEGFALHAEILHLHGRLLEREGRDPEAEEALKAALELDRAAVGYASRLAEFLAARERSDEALDVVEVGLRHRPGDDDLESIRRRFRQRS